MKFVILTLTAILGLNLNGQITITSADMPDAGNNYVYSEGNLFFDVDLSDGENYNWNYEDLESEGNDSLQYVEVEDAPFAYQFLFNNFLIPDYLADHANQIPDMDLGGFVTFENNFVFYQNNPNDYRGLGAGVQVNDVPGVGTNDPIDIIYNFPMNYGDMDTSYTELSLEIPGLYSYNLEQTRRNFVDGWGTLSLPIGEYECLRVRTEIEATDSIFVNLLDLGFSIPRPLTVEYKWLANGEGTPVLQINESGGFVNSIQYRDTVTFIPDNINEILSQNITLSPIPAKDFVSIETTDELIEDYVLFSPFGRMILMEKDLNERSFDLDLGALTNGQYILIINTDKGQVRKKITKI